MPDPKEDILPRQESAPPETIPSPYPAVPPSLPDFNKGYLFNEAREISVAAPGEETENESEDTQLTDIVYSGSIITGDIKRGLLVFSQAPRSPVRSSSMRPPPTGGFTQLTGGEKKSQQVMVGDDVSGYKVQEIHPDRIIFAKNGQTVEKSLYDAEKKRTIAPKIRREIDVPQQIPPPDQIQPPLPGQMPEPATGATDSRNDQRIPQTKSSSLRSEGSPALRRPRPQSADNPIPTGLRIPVGNIPPPPEGAQ